MSVNSTARTADAVYAVPTGCSGSEPKNACTGPGSTSMMVAAI